MNTPSRDVDTQAIVEAVDDYYGGWYEANPERISRSLHADLAKRAIKLDESGKESLRHLTKEMMVNATRKGGGNDAPADKRHWTITNLDRYKEIAMVRVEAGEYIEYIQLVKQTGQWLIVNVLWTDNRADLQ